ncbi:MAG: hypothetical protein ABIP35_10285 [Ginsengibacter sp.]
MKIEHILIHYLLKNKQLNLQNIGVFKLEASLPDTADPEKPIIIPEGAISFQYDSRTEEDKGLVDFILEYTGKIRPLAASDLESYLMLGRQFLNIGNPFIIPNIGTLHKTNSGNLVFKAGLHSLDKVNSQREKIEDEGAEEHDENMFNEYQRPIKSNNGKFLLIGITLLIVGFIAWAVWRYIFQQQEQHVELTTTELIVPVADSSRIKDSLALAAIAADSTVSKKSTDGFTFKIVVNEYSTSKAAEERLAKLKTYGRNAIMFTTDSITFKVAEAFTNPLSDTTRIKDSLNLYYGKNKTKLEY